MSGAEPGQEPGLPYLPSFPPPSLPASHEGVHTHRGQREAMGHFLQWPLGAEPYCQSPVNGPGSLQGLSQNQSTNPNLRSNHSSVTKGQARKAASEQSQRTRQGYSASEHLPCWLKPGGFPSQSSRGASWARHHLPANNP